MYNSTVIKTPIAMFSISCPPSFNSHWSFDLEEGQGSHERLSFTNFHLFHYSKVHHGSRLASSKAVYSDSCRVGSWEIEEASSDNDSKD